MHACKPQALAEKYKSQTHNCNRFSTLPGGIIFFFAILLPNRFFELPYIKIGYNKKLAIIFPAGTITASPGKKSCKK
jgi:hypothetical protein